MKTSWNWLIEILCLNMQKIKSFKDLIVWQKSITLAQYTYTLTSNFPKKEMYILCDQMNRAAVSISSNIAEGFGRQSKNEFSRFLKISLGSLFELMSQIMVAKKLLYIQDDELMEFEVQFTEISKMLYALIKKQQENSKAPNS